MSLASVLARATAAEALLSKLASAAPEAEALASAAFSLIAPAVVAAEGSGKAGPDKMSAVLNTVEAQMASHLPSLKINFGEIATDVRDVVNDLVADYNKAKLFVKGALDDAKAIVHNTAGR